MMIERRDTKLNLKELKLYVDHTIENLHNYHKPEEIEVLITLSESSMGSRASTRVKFVGLGFDWESKQFRIEPEIPIVRKGNALTDIKKVECRKYDGRNYYFCPRCQSKINKDDDYCRYCSQKLK